MNPEIKTGILAMDTNDPVYMRFFSETIASPTTLFHQLPDMVHGLFMSQMAKVELLTTGRTQLAPKNYLFLEEESGKILHSMVRYPNENHKLLISNRQCQFANRAEFYIDILNPGLNAYLENYVDKMKPNEITPISNLTALVPDRLFINRLSNNQKEKFIRTGLLELKDNSVLSVDRDTGNLLFTPADRLKTHLLYHGEVAFKYDDEKILRQKSLDIVKQLTRGNNKGNEISL
ncbi:hypothetical protein [Chitinophaga rhizophila]|uniref:Uncharacterized protein n=1 Tax=Chitinophaga rhizophila TaxID=2866212 RepID=A0ABS7G802_9BACT|nr:hypothetical protein [Chitinophaga rhizophila]MBW8683430.1 hypothetical protein [Chitinophaga rhizophila]